MPRVPGSKAHKVYLGAGSSQELISDQACLLKKVHLVLYMYSSVVVQEPVVQTLVNRWHDSVTHVLTECVNHCAFIQLSSSSFYVKYYLYKFQCNIEKVFL